MKAWVIFYSNYNYSSTSFAHQETQLKHPRSFLIKTDQVLLVSGTFPWMSMACYVAGKTFPIDVALVVRHSVT